MKKGKIFLMSLLALLVSSISLTSCGQNVDSSKNSGNSTSIIRDPDEVYVSSIEVVNPPKKTNYIPLEEAFNSEGMIIKATWSDGYVEDNVSPGKYYVEPSGILPEGIDHVTIHYGDASVDVSISTSEEKALYIKQVPVKTDYTVGEEFVVDGLILGYQIGEDKRDIENYDISKVIFNKKPLTKQDKFVKVTYEGISINVPINVHNETLKIELEDNSIMTYGEGTLVDGKGKKTPGSKLAIKKLESGKYVVGSAKDEYETYEEAYEVAYNKTTTAGKTMVKQASSGDFLAFLDGTGASFTINLKNVTSASNELYIRGASNWVTNMQNWTPYQVGDIYLKDFMTVEVNGVEHSLKDDLVLHGCGDGTKGDHSYWTNWETLDLGKITLNPALEINTIKFTVAIDKGLDENDTYKYMYNNNGMYAFGQYDYVLLEDVE